MYADRKLNLDFGWDRAGGGIFTEYFYNISFKLLFKYFFDLQAFLCKFMKKLFCELFSVKKQIDCFYFSFHHCSSFVARIYFLLTDWTSISSPLILFFLFFFLLTSLSRTIAKREMGGRAFNEVGISSSFSFRRL